MTPLAHRIVKELTLPVRERTFQDGANLLRRMDDIHCFDITEVFDLLVSVMDGDVQKVQDLEQFVTFLPAPKTWIEWAMPTGDRAGFLLEERPGFAEVRVAASCYRTGEFYSATRTKLLLPLDGAQRVVEIDTPAGDADVEVLAKASSMLFAALAFINTPRIIGRRQHMPHRGLERRLLKERKNIGHFPLNAWTEILLNVTPPKDASGEASHEAHLTGQRALHFCRAHLRIRRGRLEVVRAHWRGDASLGIKRSRYKVAA